MRSEQSSEPLQRTLIIQQNSLPNKELLPIKGKLWIILFHNCSKTVQVYIYQFFENRIHIVANRDNIWLGSLLDFWDKLRRDESIDRKYIFVIISRDCENR